MWKWLERRRERKARERLSINAKGQVRGWHRGCPAGEPGFLGTYALVPGPGGRVDCEACGAEDLRARDDDTG